MIILKMPVYMIFGFLFLCIIAILYPIAPQAIFQFPVERFRTKCECRQNTHSWNMTMIGNKTKKITKTKEFEKKNMHMYL